ncbi:MAG TPA: hypothetical protein VG826_00280 [Pirellulales bacterium]|nr:hypothetical protein [Pirellulales bacterium]
MNTSRLPKSPIPPVIPVRQHFNRPRVKDLAAATAAALAQVIPDPTQVQGKVLGLTAPSRGIGEIGPVLRHLAGALRSFGAIPKVLTAMGTHGGGTAEGNLETAQNRGIDLERVGAEVIGDIETTHLDTIDAIEVYVGRAALSCDGVILVNRIKEHTDILWETPLPKGHFGLESGWAKILALGLSHLQALAQHQHVHGRTLGVAIETSARRIIRGGEVKVLGGVGIIENAYDETAAVVGAPVSASDAAIDAFFATEARHLATSKALMPKLPFGEIDVLWCHWLGKNLSGQGMHTKTIGRSPYGAVQGQPWVTGTPRIFNIIASALTPGNHGNAIGMGLCEFITERFRAAVDLEVTALNCLTALCPCQARMPIVMPNDREALATALAVSPVRQRPHLVLIHSTLKLTDLVVSPGALEDSERYGSSLDVRGEPREIPFTADGHVHWEMVIRAGD